VAAGAILLVAALISIPLGLDLYMPVPEDNPLTAEKVALGRRLFHDPRLSRDGTIACASCHNPARAFTDSRSVAVGVSGRYGRRNVPTLVNRAWGRLFFWDGRVRTLEEQVLRPIEDPNEMNLPVHDAAARVGVSTSELSQALAGYVRSIMSGNSPYDRFNAGDRNALNDEQQIGLQIFRGKGNCTRCHVGPTFTDERLHNTGVAWRDGRLADEGGGDGTFKTPTLREVSRTAPYMHDGSLDTLQQVIEFYDGGGNANPALDPEIRPLRLTEGEKRALVAFLSSLTGTVQEGLR
jgi:cytochrome c peroxidase